MAQAKSPSPNRRSVLSLLLETFLSPAQTCLPHCCSTGLVPASQCPDVTADSYGYDPAHVSQSLQFSVLLSRKRLDFLPGWGMSLVGINPFQWQHLDSDWLALLQAQSLTLALITHQLATLSGLLPGKQGGKESHR